ncbi:hypothetical protein BGZ73_006259 [Actinomortierella ambigua]|nr:hypothetical protein BGZ73_006259 [Actinomortierella ambigua]
MLAALIAFYLLNFKSLPGVYNLRSVRFFIRHRNLKEPLTGLLEPHKYHSRVWFDDMDLNIHLSNSSYNKMLDYARIELCCRLFPGWQSRHHFDMRLAQTVCFFKAEVPKFSKYTITSRVFTWDDKWIWFSHRFSIKRKTRPVRRAKAIEGTAASAASATDQLASEQRKDDGVQQNKGGDDDDDDDEDDIDPIDEKANHLPGSLTTTTALVPTNHPAAASPEDPMAGVPERLCCIAYSRMVAKDSKGKTITPEALFKRMGHQEAYPGQWEEYRAFGMTLIEGMMKIGSQPADPPTVGKKVNSPTRAKI